jgi:hypothetical protein
MRTGPIHLSGQRQSFKPFLPNRSQDFSVLRSLIRLAIVPIDCDRHPGQNGLTGSLLVHCVVEREIRLCHHDTDPHL